MATRLRPMAFRVRPSEILQEFVINELGWSIEEAAEKIGIPFVELTAILENRIPISPEAAQKLEAAGYSTAAFWLRLEEKFRLPPL